MPYKIKKKGGSYAVVKGGKGKSGGKFSAGHVFGRHKSKKSAQRQLAAIHANEGKFEDRLDAILESLILDQ